MCCTEDSHGFIQTRTLLLHPVSLCGSCKTSGHPFPDEACARRQLQCTTVVEWCKRFKEGRSSTEDLTRPGRPPYVADPDTLCKVDQMEQCDRRVMHRRVSEHLGIIVERVHQMVSAVWLPKILNDEQKTTRMGICWEYVLRYEKDKFLDLIVRGASPGVCTMIQGLNARFSSENICNLPTEKESHHSQRW